ncbi:MAG: ATP-binding cassette domain-containing protein [Bacteroidales bacterium]
MSYFKLDHIEKRVGNFTWGPIRCSLEKGDILLDNHSITPWPPFSYKAAMVYQDVALFPHLTVQQNISHSLKSQPKEITWEKVNEVAVRFSIYSLLERNINKLSGGEKNGLPWQGLSYRKLNYSCWINRSLLWIQN